MDPNLYRWCPCTIHGCLRQPLPPPTQSRESSLIIRSSFGPPSLGYSHSTSSSDSMRSAPPTPPPTASYHFEAEAYARRVQEGYRPNDNVVPSVYEPQARKPGHRVFVLARDRDKQSNTPNKPLVRCPPTVGPAECFRPQHLIYMLWTGSHPTQESLPPRPDVVLSSRKTGPKFSFEPHELPKTLKKTSRDRQSNWFSPNPINDPRDPIVEQTNQRTLQRLRPNIKPSPGLSSPPSWTPKPIISPLAMVLDHLEQL
ncbi:MAG: hypothetical protein NXY57DRAFT_1003398 [Lentinula lateritia]|nr:MAG: hypothetical protein NXY57DRAFT_1003398 [Lentinula lateritia]